MPLPGTSTLVKRLSGVRETLGTLGLDALIVTNSGNVRYLSNHVGTAGILVVTGDATHLLVDARYSESARALQQSPAACPGLQTWRVPGGYDEALVGCLKEIGARATGFEAAHLTVARHAWIREAVEPSGASVRLQATERVVERARLIKDAEEVATLRAAAAALSGVAEAAFRAVAPG
ncbi:MAG: aminopeptidase P family N-terminal domain-containing protein, partial [Vicinamibacterales bacterium]